jgi:hypothetical protein
MLLTPILGMICAYFIRQARKMRVRSLFSCALPALFGYSSEVLPKAMFSSTGMFAPAETYVFKPLLFLQLSTLSNTIQAHTLPSTDQYCPLMFCVVFIMDMHQAGGAAVGGSSAGVLHVA